MADEEEEHVGGWAHIEIWIEHPEGFDPPNHKTNPDHPIIKLFDPGRTRLRLGAHP